MARSEEEKMLPKTKWLVLWSLWLARMVPQPSPVVHVEQGALRGRLAPDGSHYQFFGIPYATSNPQYRFKAPGPEPKWKGIYEAINEHIKCPQRYGPWLVLGYEDCLILNVYRPLAVDLDAPLPVMVYIHGGGFKEGSGSRLLYGPDYLVTRGIVLVTFNYRLDLEGFLCLGIKEAPGNAGMKDQVAALKWVQRNIRAFGGDPDNVTIFGESAGGTSVSLHLLSPLSHGLYHKAIIQSGSSFAPWGLTYQPMQTAIATAKELGFDIEDTHQIYKLFISETISNLIKAEIPTRDGQLAYLRFSYVPCIERKINGSQPFLTDSPFDMLSRGEYNKVPIIIGATDHEGYILTYFESEQSLKNIRFEETLPLDLYFPTESERLAVGEQVKQLYMGGDKTTWDNIVKLSLLHGEPYFTYPVQAETELLLQASDHPAVYSYIFEYSGWRNFAKFVGNLKFWGEDGASHADDIFYLFSLFPMPSMFEHHMINTMTTLWTNFAKYGEPNRAMWPPAQRDPLLALYIKARPQLKPLHDFRPQHMGFWRNLYDKYRAPLNFTSMYAPKTR
ncbi:unnamed protein product [Arctia plantaginis]|uniref:Carboxylic ester hydrolase n=1 Tax=Arctia plantaginis TaxID=874455 RepID=A0A8S1AFW2_ARCPL|nr:unnamed protein product [Arctia plantaginis]